MTAQTFVKAAASTLFLLIVANLIVLYLSACSSFNAEAVVNPLTGAAKISIHATK